jgi:chaperonin GroES
MPLKSSIPIQYILQKQPIEDGLWILDFLFSPAYFLFHLHENIYFGEENKNMRLRPLQDRIIVRRLEEEAKTAGGIYIPETAKEKPQRGEIVAAGKGKKGANGALIPVDVKVGDKVLFGKYGGTEIKIEGQEYLIIREDDILGVLE